MTKAGLARALSSTHQTVSKWEDGTVPGGEMLAKVADLLDVSGHWLLTGTGPMERPGAVMDMARVERVAALAERGRVLRAIRATLDGIAHGELARAVQEVTEGLPPPPAAAGRKRREG